jgi:DNA-binding transcriptional ArsR family regulator
VRQARRRLLRRLAPAVLSRSAEALKLLGHPERLLIVEALERGELSVTDIRTLCDLEQAICSQHLRRLRRLGVVACRREGVHIYYRLNDPKVRPILACIRACDAR